MSKLLGLLHQQRANSVFANKIIQNVYSGSLHDLTDQVTSSAALRFAATLENVFPPAKNFVKYYSAPDKQLPFSLNQLYFLRAIPQSSLLPDGTDALHWPGAPFFRRRWAGGNLSYSDRSLTIGKLAVCKETITNVEVRGIPGKEKVLVTIRREIDHPQYDEGKHERESNLSKTKLRLPASPAIIERRILVFMRPNDPSKPGLEALSQSRRLLTPRYKTPPWSHSLALTPEQLFRYSALTFNNHKIHLSREFSQSEGLPDIIVHGPLLLNIMSIAVWQEAWERGKSCQIRNIDYHIFAPLLVNVTFKVRVKTKVNIQNMQRNDSTAPTGQQKIEIETSKPGETNLETPRRAKGIENLRKTLEGVGSTVQTSKPEKTAIERQDRALGKTETSNDPELLHRTVWIETEDGQLIARATAKVVERVKSIQYLDVTKRFIFKTMTDSL